MGRVITGHRLPCYRIGRGGWLSGLVGWLLRVVYRG